MTKTLTEQWRDGTLPDGFYYMQDYTGRYHYRYLLGVKPDADFVKCFKEVLAPVPSYDEWKQAKENLEKNGTWYTERSYKLLEKRLEIATKALKKYANCKPTEWMSCVTADEALKEMEGVK